MSIYSHLVVFTNIHAKGCYRTNKELEQKEFEQQLQAPHSEQQLQASTQASHQFTPCALHQFLWKMGKNIIHSAQLQALPHLYTGRASRYLRLWKRLSTEKLLKQSILNNYNLRITKAGLAITEVRVNQHEVLLHAQEWTCTEMLFNSDGSNSSTATYPHDFTAIRKMEVKSSKELYIIHFLCPPPRGPQPRKPPFTKVSPPNSCDCQ